VLDGVTVIGMGVLVGDGSGVVDGIVEQSVIVFTFPKASKVTAYLASPSIINENPPGFDGYVLFNNVESL
jgi:hypothetical protein